MQIKANLVDVVNRKIFPALIKISDKKIKSIKKTDERLSTFLLPGFVDAHIHIESSMLIPSEFARLAVCHGSVATVSDPHEIANVMGIEGIEFMIENGKSVDFKFYFGAPSCVPATEFETNGAKLGVKETEELLKNPDIKFLSEVMNFPAVIGREKEIMQKIELAKRFHKPVDGHAPALKADMLKKYISAGITTDHESSSYEEAKEKLDNGMKILIREGSAAKNFEALHPLIDDYYDNLMFCSDDRHPNDLKKEHINALVKRAVDKGYDLFKVLRIASHNPVKHYDLDVGLLQEGDRADFIEVKDLKDFEIIQTVIDGKRVYHNKKVLIHSDKIKPINNFNTLEKRTEDFLYRDDCKEIEVISAVDHELFTKEKRVDISLLKDKTNDILKISVTNRYEDKKPALSFVHGFGLKRGAIASSVAHDSHNIISVGCSDEEMAKAVNLIIKNRGGISAVNDKEQMILPLKTGGIMSEEDAFEVANRYEQMDRYVKDTLNSSLSAPFMTLSFMALLVIPTLKLSDKGLFDSKAFHFIEGCKI